MVPPGTGIVHQVNIEHLARVVMSSGGGQAYPDTLVGTDSHTTMVNGLGVLGWGVGGIEAEAAMLGQPVSMLIPRVVGFKLNGALPEGATATDLVLTITEMLRKHGVVGKFVEFYGPGVAAVPLANRATIGNMSPEYGSTVRDLPDRRGDAALPAADRAVGASRSRWSRRTPRSRGSGTTRPPSRPTPSGSSWTCPRWSRRMAGPKRPQDRVALADAKTAFRAALPDYVSSGRTGRPTRRAAESFPARDPPAGGHDDPADKPHELVSAAATANRAAGRHRCDGDDFELDHGAVVIAAITSCTNTSNPPVMIGAALLAKNAVERGLTRKPWVKTTLAPGSKVVMDYYERAGLTPYLEKLGFHLVGYGCTTCIGNSGPLPEETQRGRQRARPVRRLGAVRQPQLRRPDQPRRQDELPGLAAAGGGVRAGRNHGHRPGQRAARRRLRRQAGVPARHLADGRTRSKR